MSDPSARPTPHGWLLLCRRFEGEGWLSREPAEAADISCQTASMWLGRWRGKGREGPADRSSRPRRVLRRMVGHLPRRVVLLRLTKCRGPDLIAWHARLAPATVCRTLWRHGLQHLRALESREPAARCCWPHSGDLVHLDTKRLGRIGAGGGSYSVGHGVLDRHRGMGWDYAHVAVDDATRLAYAEQRPDERDATAATLLARALAFFASHGIEVQRLLSDNGSFYCSRIFAAACAEQVLRHWRTQSNRPQSNGNAEAFVRILQNGWAYKRPYDATDERIAALAGILVYYNGYRSHGSLEGDTTLGRLTAYTTS